MTVKVIGCFLRILIKLTDKLGFNYLVNLHL